jgi:hypothetical protein
LTEIACDATRTAASAVGKLASMGSNMGADMRYMKLEVARFCRRALVALVLPCSLARADVVADWNAIAFETVTAMEQNAAQVAYAMATVHVAMFEVMNFIEGAYAPRFLVKPPAPLGRSGEAAAAAAAHYVLLELHPGRRAALDAALERSLAPLRDEQEKSAARTWGRHLGANIYAVRSADKGDSSSPGAARAPAGPAATPDSVAKLAAMYAAVAAFVESRRLRPIDAAKVHAAASMAVSDALLTEHNSQFSTAQRRQP